jgi:hypothetical protein
MVEQGQTAKKRAMAMKNAVDSKGITHFWNPIIL